jgi:hypothetical protein
MVRFVEMVGVFAQMEEDVGPVILINKFSVDPEEFDLFMKGWAAEAEKFKQLGLSVALKNLGPTR